MWEKKRDLKYRYDSTADVYDGRYREVQKRKYRAIQEDLSGARCLLDVGCGTGLLLDDLPRCGGFVVGVDFSREMLRRAEERFDGVSLILADADNLPFQDESFDTVVSLTLLQNMPDPKRTVREMARVTEAGGKVIVTTLKKIYSIDDIEGWMASAKLKPFRSERIPDSEDILCVGRREE